MSTVTSLLTQGTNTHKETVEKFNLFQTYLLADGILPQSGTIVDASPDTGPFAVVAQGTPDMTVAVKSTGTPYAAALITGTPTSGVSQKVISQCTADENVTIAANTSGSTKYDWIYIKLDPDLMKDPTASASTTASFVASRSTSSSTDDGTPPTYGLNLAVVTVVNGASTIANSAIADKRVYALLRNGYVTGQNFGKAEGAGCTRAAVQAITTATNTAISWDTEVWDTDSFHSTASNQSRFTIPTGQGGLFQINFNVAWNHNATGTFRVMKLYKNGADVSPRRWEGAVPNAVAGNNDMNLSATISLAAADYIECVVIHDLGSNLNVLTAWGEIYRMGNTS